MEFKNKVAMITGAAGALGSELALACALSDWETILLDSDKRGLNKLYDRIVDEGGVEPTIMTLDLASMGPQEGLQIINALETGTAKLDALIHCAVSFDGLQPLDQIQPQHWLRQLQVNLNAPWLLSVSCLSMLRESPQASLYFIGEDVEKLSAAFWGVYGISKTGLNTLAEQFAAELGNTNIQVLVLNPGPMRSPLRAKVYHTENPQDIEEPKVAAGRILQLLERRIQAKSCQLNLQQLSSHAEK